MGDGQKAINRRQLFKGCDVVVGGSCGDPSPCGYSTSKRADSQGAAVTRRRSQCHLPVGGEDDRKKREKAEMGGGEARGLLP